MKNSELIEIQNDILNRLLGVFPRVDTMMSTLLALDLGLLAVLASNAPSFQHIGSRGVFLAVLYILFAVVGFYHLYKCAFPRLDGGHTSLIYFREIANKTEIRYNEEFMAITEEKVLEDLIEQTWRNSSILKEKYDHLRWAFIFLILALVFWLPALMSFASNNTERLLAK